MFKKRITLLATHLILLGFVMSMTNTAEALFHRPVQATASTYYNGTTHPQHMVRPAGTSGTATLNAESTSAIHAVSGGGSTFGQWHAKGPVADQWVTFQLGTDLGGGAYEAFNLTALYLWNCCQNQLTPRGIKDFTIWASSDGGANYTQVSGALVAQMTPKGQTSVCQTFVFNAVNVTHIKLDIDSNYDGSNYACIAEVRFENDLVPVVVESPYVEAGWAWDITQGTAMLVGELIEDGNDGCFYWFSYWPEGPTGSVQTSDISWPAHSGDYTMTPIEGLKADTWYFFRAHASNYKGEGVSPSIASFKTLPLPPVEGRIAHLTLDANDIATVDPSNADSPLLAVDITGNGYDAELTGQTVLSGGARGQALAFDGTSFLALSDSNTLPMNNADHTISLWVNTTSDDKLNILAHVPTNGNHQPQDRTLGMNAGGSRVGKLAVDQGWVGACYGSAVVNDGEWHHVVVTQDYSANEDGSNTEMVALYVDGILDGSATWTNGRADDTSAYHVTFGGGTDHAWFPNFFVGVLDDLQIFNKVLSLGEIMAVAEGR